MGRKKNPAIKATGATSSKAAPLPDWVKGGAPKPPAYTKAAREGAAPDGAAAPAARARAPPPPSAQQSATNAQQTPAGRAPAAAGAIGAPQPDNRPPPLFPPGVKPPVSVLNERVQKHHAAAGWLRPSIEPRRARRAVAADEGTDGEASQAENGGETEPAWSAVVVLTKTNKANASEPFVVRMEPKAPGESMTEWTSGERGKDMARQLGAVYALFRMCNNLSLNRVLPTGGPREYWSALEAHKAAAPAHQEWMWAADPFEAAAKRTAEQAAKQAKREKEAAAQERGEPTKTGGKRWEEAREVRMSAKLRERTEACVRAALQIYPAAAADDDASPGPSGTQTPQGPAQPDAGAVASLVAELQKLGFRPGSAKSAARWVLAARAGVAEGGEAEAALRSGISSLGDREAALEYLVLFTPEAELPKAFAPSQSSDSFVTSSAAGNEKEELALRWGAERLVKHAGFPRPAVVQAIKEAGAALPDAPLHVRESLAIDVLLARLVGDEAAALAVCSAAGAHVAAQQQDPDVEAELARKRADERMALGAVLGDERIVAIADEELSLSSRERVGEAFDVVIATSSKKNGGDELRLRFTPGMASQYPSAPSEGLPALPTFYIASKTLPASLRLALTARLVRASRNQPDWQEMLEAGEGGLALAMVEELETSWRALVDDPPDLAGVMRGLLPAAPKVERAAAVEAPVKATRAVRPTNGTARPALRRDAGVDARLQALLDDLRSNPAHRPMASVRAGLPAANARESILKLLSSSRVVIIAGETGCGKTTQVPQFILDAAIDAGEGSTCQIVVTQPRRVSAMGVASRVAEERGEKIGSGVVGYAIRGERKASRDCRLLFSTTGVLLRRLATGDVNLASLSHVIVDEVHERSVDSDFLLLELRRVLQRNPKLRVILMSATIDQQTFSSYFDGAPCIEIPGRTFPVEDHYLEELVPMARFRPSQRGWGGPPSKAKSDKQVAALRASMEAAGLAEDDVRAVEAVSANDRVDYDLLGAAAKLVCERAQQQERDGTVEASTGGAILVFLPGVGEIKQAMEAIRAAAPGQVDILPLHANISPEEQRRVFLPSARGRRKIVCSTNVAETSITIPDISYVIDSGRVKETRFEAESGLTRLVECWASRAACRQRRGRAGRTRAGECWKLFTRHTEERFMMPQQTPEMRRVPLESLFLQAKAMSDDLDIKSYLQEALDPPSLASMDKALATLIEVGAIHQDRGFRSRLTALGRHLSNLPLDLRLGKLLILGACFGCLAPMLSVAAIMSCKPLFLAPFERREEAKQARERFATGNSDLLTDAAAFAAWARLRAQRVSNAELRDFCESNFLSASSLRDIQSTRSDLLSQLEQLGFVASSYNAGAFFRGEQMPLDAHAQDVNLQRALILAGLWPSVVRVALPSAKYDQSSSGTIQREAEAKSLKYFDASGRLFLHPTSVLFSASALTGHLAVFKKGASGDGPTAKTYMRDATEVPLYALLLFGGRLQIHHMIGGISVGSNSVGSSDAQDIKLRANARIGVLCGQLRRLLDAVLADAFDRAVGDTGARGSTDADVVDTMRALIARDGLDPL